MTQGHRWFASFWDLATRHERPPQRRARRAVAGRVRGRALELGVGVGSNWRHLPEGVRSVGIDPDPHMLRRARRRATEQGRHGDLYRARAEELPFRDASFDTVFTTLTLCTVDDVARTLSEVRRVLKPGGELRFWEHVRPDGRAKGRLLDCITPVWRTLGAGCHPNRDTLAELARSGFEIRRLRRSHVGPLPAILGVAAVVERGEEHPPSVEVGTSGQQP